MIEQNPKMKPDEILKENNESPVGNPNIFLKVLVDGEISLYKYDEDYFIYRDDKIYLLQLVPTERIVGMRKFEGHVKRYMGILKYIMKDCPEIYEQIEQSKLTDRSLVSLVEEYHHLKNSSYYSYDVSFPWVQVRPIVGLGFNASKLYSPENHVIPMLEGVEMRDEHYYSAGLFMEISFPRNLSNFSLIMGGQYFASQFTSIQEKQIVTMLEKHFHHFNFHEIFVPVSLRYTFSHVFLEPYVDLGLFYSFLINTDSKHSYFTVQESNESQSIVKYYIGNDSYLYNSSYHGFWGGVGVQKNIINDLKLFFDINYLSSGDRFILRKYPFGDNSDIRKNHWVFMIGLKY